MSFFFYDGERKVRNRKKKVKEEGEKEKYKKTIKKVGRMEKN